MAETIKGINVVIGAETTGLQKSLGDVNKKSRDLQSELRQVDRLLKLDPTNTELLAQKQNLLAESVDNAREKLNRLKTAQEQVNQQFAKGEISEGQYRAFQREVAAAEQQLNKFEGELKETGNTAKKTGMDIGGLGDKLKGIGQSLSMTVTAPIVAGFAAITQGTKELRGDLATLSTNAQVAGQDMGVLNDAMVKLQAVTGETDSNVEGLSELLATGFRDEQLSTLLDSLYGASIKFKDTMKFEGIADGLQETLATGAAIGPFGELLERSGIALEGFNAGLTAAIANGTQEQYVLDILAKTGLAETYEAYRKNNEEMVKAEEANFRMQQSFAQLGATLEPILTPIINKITELANKFNEIDPAGQKIALVIAGIAAAIGPILLIISSLIGAIGTISAALPAFGAAFAVITGPIGLAIAAIAALIAVGVLVYRNWDEIKAKLGEVWGAIVNFFTVSIPTAINAGLAFFAALPGQIATFMNELPGKIGYALGLALGTLVKFGVDAINWAITEIPNFIASIIQFYMELPGKIGEWLQAALAKVAEWGSSLITWAKTNLPNVISTIVGFFTSLPQSLLDVGVNMVKGLWNGIQSMVGWIGDKISGFVDGIVAGFKEGMDIQSPSRVMAAIGKNISLGLAEGMLGAASLVDDAVTGLLDSMILRTDLIAAGNTNNYNSGGNTVNITVQDGEDLIDMLRRKGIKI